MQKISSYLYSNRVVVNLDLASSPLEWRIVYQKKLKIYKGFDNVIELDIKNSDQKRINVSNKTLKCVLMDTLGQEVYTASVVHSATPGLATFTVPATALGVISPQFLRYTVYVLNLDNTKSPIYGDTQFGVTGMIDYIGDALPQVLPPKVLSNFTYLHDTATSVQTFYSDSVEINPPNDITATPVLTLEFIASGLAAEVKVQMTKDPVVSTATVWTTLETFTITTSTSTLSKTYNSATGFNKEAGWLRVTYVRATNNTGKFDKVLVSV
jgi:hypothetical protein